MKQATLAASHTLPIALPIAQVGAAILREKAVSVQHFNETLAELAEQMRASMLAANGVGIAATQVFSPLALFIMASRPNPRYPNAPTMSPVVVVNPEIISTSDELVLGEEGCLSVPAQRFSILRHQTIQVRYQDLHANWHHAELSGFVARIFQHEYDHLQGITLLERIQMPEQHTPISRSEPQ